MAGDITSTIRFIADASQAIGTMRALAAEATALNQSVSRIQGSLAAQQTGGINVSRGQYSQIRSAQNPLFANQVFNLPSTSVIDQFNKTLRTTHEAVVLNAEGTEIFRSTLSGATGDLRQIEQALGSYGRVQETVNRSTAQLESGLSGERRGLQGTLVPHQQRIQSILQEREALKSLLQTQIDARLRLPNPQPTGFRSSAEDLVTAQARHNAIAQAEQRIRDTETALQRNIAAQRQVGFDSRSDPAVIAAQGRIKALEDLVKPTQLVGQRLLNAAQGNIDRAVGAPPPLPAALETVRQESPSLFNRLAKQGVLGSPGVVDIRKIYESGADQLQLTRDLERGTTSLRGSIRGLNGELININAAYAEGGRVIGRYGGALSGVQNFLRQTVNDFTKVVQWGLATTAMFAGLGLATSAIDTVKNLDAALNQLSITAQLSGRQTREVFSDLAQIAYDTSTPLQEMVKSADDIALATKRANQSTVEWQANIKSLAESVGVLTNITGLDTVRATDLLTSTMKQLNLTAEDIPTIINKVAAVSGGQANAIQDVISGLGVMAEAAQQANLTIDQTVATVQVLGQVTSKSSSEIATSFKNLVGSVDSVGAQKAFDKYNISIKDSAGQLRNILDIYAEINEKIRSGVIPEADVKALVKAIAGGPRRAPDAAALLANVDAIREATVRASQATNEAAVANAKYLDTIESKIIQLQVKFQTFLQKNLGAGIKGAITDVLGVLSTLIDIIGSIPPGLIHVITSLGALLIATKLVGTAFRFFIGAGRDVIAGLRLFNAAAVVGSQAFKLTGTTAQVSAAQVVRSAEAQIAATEAQLVAYRQLAAQALATGNAESISATKALVAAGERQRAAAIEQQAAAQRVGVNGGLGGVAGRVGSSLRSFGAGALLGGGLSLAAGAASGQGINIPDALANAGITGGFTLALNAPILPLKALGLAIAGVSFFLSQFTQKNNEAAASQDQLKQEVLASIESYNQSQASVVQLTRKQQELLQLYKTQANPKQGTVDVGALNATVQDYIQTSFDLKAANEQVAESFKQLEKDIPNLSDEFKAQIDAAQQGLTSVAGLKKIQEAIYKEIFQAQNPEDFALANKPRIVPTPVSPGSSPVLPEGSNIFTLPGGIQRDLANLQFPTDALDAFDLKTGKLIDTLKLGPEQVDLIRNALEQAAANGADPLADDAQRILDIFNATVQQGDAIQQALDFTKQQKALLTTQSLLKQINSDQLAQGTAVTKVYNDLIELAAKLPKAEGAQTYHNAPSTGTSEGVQAQIQSLLTDNGAIRTRPFNIEESRKIADLYREAQGWSKELKLSDDDIYNIMTKNLGLAVNWTSQIQQAAAATEEMQKRLDNLAQLKVTSLDDMASKIGNIQKQFLTGDITKKMRDSMINAAKATNGLIDRLADLFSHIADEGNPILAEFEKRISVIPGLENLVGKNADEAAQLMAQWLNSMNLTGKGADALVGRVVRLIAAIEAIPPYKEFFLKFRTEFIQTEGNSPDARDQVNKVAQYSYSKTIADIQKEIQKLLGTLKTVSSGGGGYTYSSSTGGKSGSTKTATPPDISELDLPDEIANATNRSALIQEAIKRARALQHLIPGADKEAKNDIVELLKGTQRILEVRGIKDDYLRRALEELADVEKKRLEFETKADTIRRIRVGTGTFAAIANVPVNTKTGVSLGSPNGPINVTLNLNGTVLTPAQLAQFADLVAAALKRQIANG